MKKLFQTLALVSLAIAGMMVSSCQVENIQTSFEPQNAVAKIIVTVIDASNGTDVTNSPDLTLTATNAEKTGVAGEFIVKGNPGISETVVTITAKYLDNDEVTKNVTVKSVLPGGVASYGATIIIGTVPSPSPFTYLAIEKGFEILDVNVGTFTSSHGLHTYTHDYSHATHGFGFGSGKWLYNESEFILNTTVDYENEYGTIGASTVFEPGHTAADMKMVMDYEKALYGKKAVKEPAQLQIEVSAFAMYSAFCTKTHTSTTYNIIRREEGKDDVHVGTVKVLTIVTQAEYCEAAIPGHEGHYHFGHGHDDVHGYSSNAGGGIMWTE